MIVDDKFIGIALQKTTGGIARGLTIQEPRIATVMRSYFDMLWEKAEPIGGNWYKDLKEKLKK